MKFEVTSDLMNQFEADYDSAQEIAVQNEAYENILIDTDYTGNGEEFRSIVIDGLYDQQADTVFQLANSADDHESYTNLARAYNALERRLEELADQYEVASSDIEAYETRLRMLAAKSIQIAPNKETEINKLLQQKLAEAKHEGGREILDQLAEMADTFNAVKELFDVAAQPWPVPIIPAQIAEVDAVEPEIDLVEDDMPIDPELTDVNDIDNDKIKRLYEKYGYTTNASIMAAAFLMENEETILTPLEIGRAVYADSDDFDGMSQQEADQIKHSRTLSLMNPNSGIVIDLLMKEGYFLQYGNRRQFSPTGKQIGNTRRVYRIVNPAKYVVGESERFFEDDDSLFDNLDVQTDVPDIEQENATTIDDIKAIEREVGLTREEKFQHRLELLIQDIKEVLPWLDDNNILPSDREGTISARYLNMRFMQLRSKGKRATKPQSVNFHAIGGDAKEAKLDISNVLANVLGGQHKHLNKDFSRFDDIKVAVDDAIDQYYIDKEQR